MTLGSSIPFTTAILTCTFIVAIVWGFHVVSLGFCMHALSTSKKIKSSRAINWGMAAISWILFANATFDMIIAFQHMLQAFALTTSLEDVMIQYALPDWTNLARTTSVLIQTIIGDAVLIYRCWIVYHGSALIIAPSVFLWLGLLGSAIWAIVLEATLNILFNAVQIRLAITVFWSFTIALNVITTGLLVYRIWSVERANKNNHPEVIELSGQSRLKDIKNIIIESGLLYTVAALVTFGTYIGGSDSVYLTSGVEVQVVGIAFNLIIVRTTYLSRRPISSGIKVDPSRGTSQSLSLEFATVTSAPRNTNPKTEIYVSNSVILEVTDSIGTTF